MERRPEHWDVHDIEREHWILKLKVVSVTRKREHWEVVHREDLERKDWVEEDVKTVNWEHWEVVWHLMDDVKKVVASDDSQPAHHQNRGVNWDWRVPVTSEVVEDVKREHWDLGLRDLIDEVKKVVAVDSEASQAPHPEDRVVKSLKWDWRVSVISKFVEDVKREHWDLGLRDLIDEVKKVVAFDSEELQASQPPHPEDRVVESLKWDWRVSVISEFVEDVKREHWDLIEGVVAVESEEDSQRVEWDSEVNQVIEVG